MATITGSKRLLTISADAMAADNTLTLGGNGVATQTWVNTQIANLVDSAPATLDTLNELAAALGDDPNFATTISNQIAGKLDSTHDMTLTLNGDVSGSATFTNMGNATLTVTVANDSHTHDGRYLQLSGGTLTGTLNAKTVQTRNTFPEAHNSYDLGTTGVRYRNVYAVNLYGDGSNITGLSSGANYYLDGLSFDTGTGILTASVNGATNQTVDLDGRYLTSLPSHNHDGRYMRMDQDTHTTGGIEIRGSLSRGTYTTASQYHTGADNIVLKGNASGISGIFFESEKDGTNINHPSDFGYIQYHAYGTSTSGEANELIIGVSNDADDHVILNAPNVNGLKFRTGASATDYTVWHSGNFTPGDYLGINAKAADSDLLDGLDLHTGRNNQANKVVRTDANGYIQAGWINTPSGAAGTINKIYCSQDDYVRYLTLTNFRSQVTDSHYDPAGASDAVNDRIDNEVIPLIGTKQDAGNYFTDGDTVLNMANNDGLVYDDTTNLMYVKADGNNYAIIDSRGGTITGTLTLSGGGTKISMNNGDIVGVNQILINDPGEGIVWTSGASGNITLAVTDDASDNILNVSGTGASLAVNGATVATQSWVTGQGYVTSSGNTIIGTDSDINTSGYNIIDNLYMTDGVITSHGSRELHNVRIEDTRAAEKTPNDYLDYAASWDFTDKITGLSGWHSAMTLQGWHDGYTAWQIIGPSNSSTHENWYLRSGIDVTWNSVRKIWHNGNLDAFVGASVSNDTITFTKANGGTVSVTTSDANTNTNYYLTGLSYDSGTSVLTATVSGASNPTVDLTNKIYADALAVSGNGTTAQFLRSDGDGTFTWATPSDTNTTYSAGSGLQLSGTTFSVDVVDGTTQTTAANARTTTSGRTYAIQFDASGNLVVNVPWVDTNTNTTYSADGNYGLTLSGTTFRLENDRRRNSSTTDIYTGNTHDYTFYDASVGIRWYTAGAEDMRLQDNGTLHVDGDVIAYSSTISDQSFKDDVVTIDNAIDKVKKLRGVEYTWNSGSRKGKRDLGLIAQEVEEVLPEIVHEHEMPLMEDAEAGKTYKTVDYEKMVGVLIEAVKEQQTQIDSLKAQVEQLKSN